MKQSGMLVGMRPGARCQHCGFGSSVTPGFWHCQIASHWAGSEYNRARARLAFQSRGPVEHQ